MKSAGDNAETQLLRMELNSAQDVVACRNRVRILGDALNMDRQDQVRTATAVSEIARNAFGYGVQASAEFLLSEAPGGMRSLVIIVRDKGPGISELPLILSGQYRSSTGMGMGVIGAKRLLDDLRIETGPAGTTVRLSKKLDARKPLDPIKIKRTVDAMGGDFRPNPLNELTEQNRELLQTLDQLGTQQEEMEKINEELSETNRGVVALYDELDTVYRVGRVVASKLDFQSLLQAITDATLDVSGAEIGAFFCRESLSEALTCQSIAGELGPLVQGWNSPDIPSLVNWVGEGQEVRRFDSSEELAGSTPFGNLEPIQSLLVVLVRNAAGENSGALVLGHRSPRGFSERTERILTSVAVQASIGLENARLYQSVQAASAAKDHFIAVLSHELRTPLTPVFAILGSFENNPLLPEEMKADLEVVKRNLQLEARLIDDLLDLTKISRGNIPLQRELVNVHSLLESVRHTCDTLIEKSGVIVTMDLTAEQRYVFADAARLQQVFWNLLNNAVKFTPANRSVLIKSRANEDHTISIIIQDHGRGIAQDALQRIFHPFEQGDAYVASQFGGLGLGLAISKSIVDAHRGTILVDSDGEGRGATFTVKLPLVAAPVEPVPSEKKPGTAPHRQARILLVDDHDDTRNVLQRLLERSGHLVASAGSCEEALRLAEQSRFDVLVSDLGLPDGSGHELLVRMHKIFPLQAIALSGFGMETDRQRSQDAGFFAHLTKPVDYKELEQAISVLIHREG